MAEQQRPTIAAEGRLRTAPQRRPPPLRRCSPSRVNISASVHQCISASVHRNSVGEGGGSVAAGGLESLSGLLQKVSPGCVACGLESLSGLLQKVSHVIIRAALRNTIESGFTALRRGGGSSAEV
eukprot:884478-Prorocentrum_minimum.AAC.1